MYAYIFITICAKLHACMCVYKYMNAPILKEEKEKRKK